MCILERDGEQRLLGWRNRGGAGARTTFMTAIAVPNECDLFEAVMARELPNPNSC